MATSHDSGTASAPQPSATTETDAETILRALDELDAEDLALLGAICRRLTASRPFMTARPS